MKIDTLDSKEYILDNGLKIITTRKDTKIASLQLGVKAGPIYEKDEEKGMSHFIEHMLFKGTQKRKNKDINNDLEDLAGSYNAYTTYTSTVFVLSGLEEELENSIEVLSDMIMNSIFPIEELKKEKSVVLSEIRNGVDDVEHLSYNRVNEFGFKKSHLRYDIAGDEKLLNSFNRDELLDFYKRFYIPNNSVISVVSSYEHTEIKRLIEKYFRLWERKDIIRRKVIDEKNIDIEKTTYKNDIEQNTILFLYTFYGLNDNEELALDILNYKLGESANSILFRELREKKGMAYDVYSDLDKTKHIKTLYIYTSVGDRDLQRAKITIEKIINDILSKDIIIDEKSIIHMKKVMKTGIISMIEDGDSLCNYILHQKLSGKKIDEFLRDLDTLEEIDTEKIYNVAKKVFNKPTIHILKGESVEN